MPIPRVLPLVVPIAATFAAPCAAQAVTASAAAGTLMQVLCTGGPTNVLPPGTPLTNGATLTTQGTTSAGTCQATSTFHPLVIGEREIKAAFDTDVSMNGNYWYAQLNAVCGAFFVAPLPARNDVLLRFAANEPVRGRFVISFNRQIQRMADVLYWVDVGDNGVVEASNVLQTQPLLPVVFGPGVLDVRISNYASVATRDEVPIDHGSGQLVLRFVPDSRCVATQIAPACGALVLEPVQNFTLGSDQVVTGLQTGGASLAALVYGFRAVNTPLPLSSGCTLTNDAFAARLLLADATGRAVHSLHTVPPAMRPFAIHAEAIELDFTHNRVTTSASYRIDCQ